jgi:hypothetical protein
MEDVARVLLSSINLRGEPRPGRLAHALIELQAALTLGHEAISAADDALSALRNGPFEFFDIRDIDHPRWVPEVYSSAHLAVLCASKSFFQEIIWFIEGEPAHPDTFDPFTIITDTDTFFLALARMPPQILRLPDATDAIAAINREEDLLLDAFVRHEDARVGALVRANAAGPATTNTTPPPTARRGFFVPEGLAGLAPRVPPQCPIDLTTDADGADVAFALRGGGGREPVSITLGERKVLQALIDLWNENPEARLTGKAAKDARAHIKNLCSKDREGGKGRFMAAVIDRPGRRQKGMGYALRHPAPPS